MLDGDQQLAHIGRQWLGQQYAEVGVEFVYVAHRLHAQMVPGDAAAIAEAGGAVVTGAGCYLRKSVGHGCVWWKSIDDDWNK